MRNPAAVTLIAAVLAATAGATAAAQPLRRASVWDLKLGEPVTAQPLPIEFQNFACGANGGPPRAQLSGFAEFARCRAEPNGLHEVYFEYDDELEYIARARDIDREITRWAGTTETGFPVIVSALFDDAGVLAGVRLVTDSRPEHRDHITEANLRKREDAYVLGGIMAQRFDVVAARDCTSLPAAEGESPVGTLFVKQVCDKADQEHRRQISIRINFFRKPGQSGSNPQLPSQMTQGQFESSARIEILARGVP